MVHCSGELVWPDGRRYCGMFADGQFDGLGIHTRPSDDLGVEISEGTWKAGQLHGHARVRSVHVRTLIIYSSLCHCTSEWLNTAMSLLVHY